MFYVNPPYCTINILQGILSTTSNDSGKGEGSVLFRVKFLTKVLFCLIPKIFLPHPLHFYELIKIVYLTMVKVSQFPRGQKVWNMIFLSKGDPGLLVKMVE